MLYRPVWREPRTDTTRWAAGRGGTSLWLGWDGDDVAMEKVGTNSMKWVLGAGGEPLVREPPSGSWQWMYTDERGSPISEANDSGVNEYVTTYDEYGRSPSNHTAWRYGYAGQIAIGSGLSFARNRVYSLNLGRFLQTDPIGYGAGMNMYGYVSADPINKLDSSGLAQQDKTPLTPPHCSDQCPIEIVGTRLQSATQQLASRERDPNNQGSGGGGGGDDAEQPIVVTASRVPVPRRAPVLPPAPASAPFGMDPNFRLASGPKHKDYCTGVPDRVGGVDISGACQAHDDCYGSDTSRSTCDARLARDIYDACRRKGDAGVCGALSMVYFSGVRTFGWIFYSPPPPPRPIPAE
jgi:RHS repeat-associated protein